MSAVIIDGQKIADEIIAEVKAAAREMKATGRPPLLRAVQLGENPASKMYVKMQQKQCEAVGISYQLDQLPEDMSEQALIEHVEKLNQDAETTGIILQMPLPPAINARKIQTIIAPAKDAEGMNPVNIGKLLYGLPRPGPCTAVGAFELIKSTGVKIEGANAVVVGHSEIVGKPIALLLLGMNATTSVCHVFTKDLIDYTRKADILVVAAGRAQAMWLRYQREKQNKPVLALPNLSPLITGDMIKDGAVVIDVAINRVPAGFDWNGQPINDEKGRPKMTTIGDVDFNVAKDKTSFITPVPGGVGPMTVAILLRNTIDCAKGQMG